ncbi:MAG: hypothetical protein OXI73_15870 [Rhodospirillales bacterium]|nr:hypothetical protein [Rhodospirillales bacterium]
MKAVLLKGAPKVPIVIYVFFENLGPLVAQVLDSERVSVFKRKKETCEIATIITC